MIANKISYYDSPNRRTLDLRPDGIDCISALERSNISNVWEDMPIHIHPGVMEFCLCLKGNLVFDTPERSYPFLPGSIFVSAPNQPHNLRHNPCGLKVYDVLFKIPKPHQRILDLDKHDSAWLAQSLTHPPKRLYASTPAVRSAFERLFETYDGEKRGTPARRVKMRAAALDLLLELVVAARRLPPKSPDWVEEIARRIRDNPCAHFPSSRWPNATACPSRLSRKASSKPWVCPCMPFSLTAASATPKGSFGKRQDRSPPSASCSDSARRSISQEPSGASSASLRASGEG